MFADSVDSHWYGHCCCLMEQRYMQVADFIKAMDYKQAQQESEPGGWGA